MENFNKMKLISKKYNYLKGLLTKVFNTNLLINCLKACNCIKFDSIFVINRTCHASHLNSAPRRVFDFYGGHVL